MQSKDFSENLAIYVNFQITAHGFTYLQEQKSQFNFLDIRNIMGVSYVSDEKGGLVTTSFSRSVHTHPLTILPRCGPDMVKWFHTPFHDMRLTASYPVLSSAPAQWHPGQTEP